MPETDNARRVRASESRDSVPLDKPRLTWAVDNGSAVQAMSTFDLWRALAAGQLEGSVLVWRLGRECWNAASEIPELACALRVSLPQAPGETAEERRTLDYVARVPSFGMDRTLDVAAVEALVGRGNAGVEIHSEAPPELADPALVVTDSDIDAIEMEAILLEADALFDDLTPEPNVIESGSPPVYAEGPRLSASRAGKLAQVLGTAAAALLLLSLPALSASAAADVSSARPTLEAPMRDLLCDLVFPRAAEETAPALETAPARQSAAGASPTPAESAAAGAKRRAKSYSPANSGQKRQSRTGAR